MLLSSKTTPGYRGGNFSAKKLLHTLPYLEYHQVIATNFKKECTLAKHVPFPPDMLRVYDKTQWGNIEHQLMVFTSHVQMINSVE